MPKERYTKAYFKTDKPKISKVIVMIDIALWMKEFLLAVNGAFENRGRHPCGGTGQCQ